MSDLPSQRAQVILLPYLLAQQTPQVSRVNYGCPNRLWRETPHAQKTIGDQLHCASYIPLKDVSCTSTYGQPSPHPNTSDRNPIPHLPPSPKSTLQSRIHLNGSCSVPQLSHQPTPWCLFHSPDRVSLISPETHHHFSLQQCSPKSSQATLAVSQMASVRHPARYTYQWPSQTEDAVRALPSPAHSDSGVEDAAAVTCDLARDRD